MIYLTAIGQPPGDSSSVHIYTQTIQRTTQNQQYIEQHKNTQNNTKIHRTTQKIHRKTQKYIEQHKKYIEKHKNQEECEPCPVFAGFFSGICLTTEEKERKTLIHLIQHYKNSFCHFVYSCDPYNLTINADCFSKLPTGLPVNMECVLCEVGSEFDCTRRCTQFI